MHVIMYGVHVYVYVRVDARVRACIYVKYVRIDACMPGMCVCVHVCMYVCLYVCMHACVHAGCYLNL